MRTPGLHASVVAGIVASLLLSSAAPALSTTGAAPQISPTFTYDEAPDDPRQDGLGLTVETVSPILEDHPNLDGGMRWDDETGTLLIRIVENADKNSRQALISKIEDQLTALDGSVPVSFGAARYPYGELDALARELIETIDQWAPAPDDIIGASAQPERGTVDVHVYEPAVGLTQAALPDARINIVPESIKESIPEAGSRYADRGGWTAGNSLAATADSPASQFVCTLNFAYRRWINNAIVGSTARHCGLSQYFHNGRLLGTPVAGNTGTDTVLLGPAANTSFSASVWVGDTAPNTTDERLVVNAARTVEDQNVSLSGATSGLRQARVLDPRFHAPELPSPRVVLETDVSRGGDSGGPWLVTERLSGNAWAYGQHYGDTPYDGVYRSSYISVFDVSAAIQASLWLPW